ncbi:MAG: S9 family peptidase [Bryobacteraceae bacterium]
MKLSWMPLAFLALAADAPVWSPAYQMKFRAVGDVTPSPDGSMAVWTERQAVIAAEKSENVTHVFAGSTTGSRRFQLTRGDKSCTAPRFSPDGAFVFFLSERSGKPNLYRIPVAGGEAEKITEWKGAIGQFRVSPDGKRIAFAGADEDKDLEKRKKEKLDFKVVGEKPALHSLWVVNLDGELPAKPEKLADGEFHVTALDWSPDSRKIAFQRVPRPDADAARHADLMEADLASRSVRPLATTAATESSPLYSPDGRWLAFESQNGNTVSSAATIMLLDRASSSVRALPDTPNEQPNLIGWAGDSKSIVFSETSHYRGLLYRMPIDGPPVKIHESLRATVTDARVNSTGTFIGYTRHSSDEPQEGWVAPLLASAAVRVSAANENLARPVSGKTEVITWKSKDGINLDGLLTYPSGYERGKRVPLVLNIHGGPAGAFTLGFDGGPGLYPIASFAAKGYAVLRPNPRGSTGRGAAFRARVIADWGGMDYGDIMAGVDHVIAMGVADPDRMAVMGWSYGGYMTAWTVTQTARFKAAAIGAGITDHVSMYGTQDIPSLYEDYFGGPPWEKPDVYRRSSPINFVNNVKTPTLIQHGEADARVPPSQAYEFHRALERRNVPTRMVVYPRQGHGVTEPKFVQQVMEEHLAWVEKYLK